MVYVSLVASQLLTIQIQKSILALCHCLSSTYNFFHINILYLTQHREILTYIPTGRAKPSFVNV